MGVVLILAMAMLSIPGVSYDEANLLGGDEADTILESDETSIRSPEAADSNFEAMTIGNDKSFAFGPSIDPISVNNLEIKTNQDSGDCGCCKSSYKRIPFIVNSIMQNMHDNGNNAIEAVACQDCCIKVNIDRIKAGDRTAIAFGFSEAANNEKILANQQ